MGILSAAGGRRATNRTGLRRGPISPSHLKTGGTEISVEAYNPGISTFQYIHDQAQGLLCAAKWGNFTLVSNGEWKMRRSPAHARDGALTPSLDFQEHCGRGRLDDRAGFFFRRNRRTPGMTGNFPEGSSNFYRLRRQTTYDTRRKNAVSRSCAK